MSNDNLIKKLKSDIKDSLKISEVFERYYYPLRQIKPDTFTAICPFHNDRYDGAFHVSDEKEIYKCFGCNESGDLISLVQKRYNCSFVDAVYLLAKDYGYISSHEFEKKNIKLNENYEIIKKKNIEQKSKSLGKNGTKLAKQEIITKVYEIFANTSGLSKSDFKYLQEERGLSKSQIDEIYFTMPLCTQGFMRRFVNNLNKEGLSEKDLIGVPGFYFDENKKKIVFNNMKGIGIKARNCFGEFMRIQVRLTEVYPDAKTGKFQRYAWFSSTGKNKGCGSGSPVDVTYPNIPYEDMKVVLFITEGKFKSEKIVSEFDSVSISVQGITSWKGKIAPEIKGIREKVKLKAVYLCYDADISMNPQVYHQCKMMVENELSKCFSKEDVYMVVWDASLGKGIDDLIDSGNKNAIKKVKFNKYVEVFEKFLSFYSKNENGELINKANSEVITKEKLYEDYMRDVFTRM